MYLKDQIPTGKSGIGESCFEGSSVRGGEEGEEQLASGKWQLGGKRCGLNMERLRRENPGGDEEAQVEE